MNPAENIFSIASRNLIFVHGKGGVGKTSVSQAIALLLSKSKSPVLWITLEDPTLPTGVTQPVTPSLWHLNCNFTQAFEEYAALKLKISGLTRLFVNNKLVRYLSKAAPGIHDLVLLGKIWFERTRYSHVVVDLPSTGYGLALFQSAENFMKLFRAGPLYQDALAMQETFRDPKQTGHLILGLPEETPLREALELRDFLNQLFPKNPAGFIVNRLFPKSASEDHPPDQDPTQWENPMASSAKDYALKRYCLEQSNLRLWKDQRIAYGELPFIPPPLTGFETIAPELAHHLRIRGYL